MININTPNGHLRVEDASNGYVVYCSLYSDGPKVFTDAEQVALEDEIALLSDQLIAGAFTPPAQ